MKTKVPEFSTWNWNTHFNFNTKFDLWPNHFLNSSETKWSTTAQYWAGLPWKPAQQSVCHICMPVSLPHTVQILGNYCLAAFAWWLLKQIAATTDQVSWRCAYIAARFEWKRTVLSDHCEMLLPLLADSLLFAFADGSCVFRWLKPTIGESSRMFRVPHPAVVCIVITAILIAIIGRSRHFVPFHLGKHDFYSILFFFRHFQGTMFNLYAKITSYQLHLETCFIPNK